MKIALKFCGHCRPNINMSQVAYLLKRDYPEIELVSMLEDISECPILLKLNACPVACAAIPSEYVGKVIDIYCLPGESMQQAYLKCLKSLFQEIQCFEEQQVTA